MPLPVYQGSGTEAFGIGDVVPGLPAGWNPGWIFLLSTEQSATNTTWAAATGYTLVTNCQQKPGAGAGDGNVQILWRRAQAGDTAPNIVDTINHTSAVIHGFSGCIETGDPWNVSNGGTDAVSDTAGSITGNTTTLPDCLICLFIGAGTDTLVDQMSGYTNGDLGSLTERSDFFHDAGNGGGVGFATGTKVAAGAYGATAVTLATASTKAFCTIALKPAIIGSRQGIRVVKQAVQRASLW